MYWRYDPAVPLVGDQSTSEEYVEVLLELRSHGYDLFESLFPLVLLVIAVGVRVTAVAAVGAHAPWSWACHGVGGVYDCDRGAATLVIPYQKRSILRLPRS